MPIELSAKRVDELRTKLLEVMRAQVADVEKKAKAEKNRIKRLEAKRRKLLQAHLAGAIPVDLLKEEQDQIAKELANAGAALACATIRWDEIEAQLDEAMDLATDFYKAYLGSDPGGRRLLNQAAFKHIAVDVESVSPELADPFASLLAEDLVEAIEAQSRHKGRNYPGRGLNKRILVDLMGLLSNQG